LEGKKFEQIQANQFVTGSRMFHSLGAERKRITLEFQIYIFGLGITTTGHRSSVQPINGAAILMSQCYHCSQDSENPLTVVNVY
jgi:hypothetical protein